MRYINPWLANVYCSITIANYGLIRLIRFVSRISTQLLKKIYKHILFNIDFFWCDRDLKKVYVNKQHLSQLRLRPPRWRDEENVKSSRLWSPSRQPPRTQSRRRRAAAAGQKLRRHGLAALHCILLPEPNRREIDRGKDIGSLLASARLERTEWGNGMMVVSSLSPSYFFILTHSFVQS